MWSIIVLQDIWGHFRHDYDALADPGAVQKLAETCAIVSNAVLTTLAFGSPRCIWLLLGYSSVKELQCVI
jgi:hypothetical protein